MPQKSQTKPSSFLSAGVTTTISISLVLILLGMTLLLAFGGREILSFIKENLSISVEIPEGTNQAGIAAMQKELNESPYVKAAIFISKEEIKQQLIKDLGRDPEEVIGYNPAHNLFELKLKSEYANTDSIKSIEKQLKDKNIIGEFLYDEQDVNMVNSNLSKIGVGLLVIAVMLMIISFALIQNTIRLNIYAKRFIINTMQLVGATNGFIRKPFVANFIICGIIAAILANLAITGFVYSATKEYPELISIIKTDNLLIVYGGVFILGILLTLTATIFSVNRYLKMETNNLYHI